MGELIYKKIVEVMADINAVSKGRRNAQQGFQFRGIDDVMNELHGSLSKCGVFVVPQVLEEERTTGKTKSGSDMFYTRLKINFSFYAEDGSHIDAVVIGEAMDTGDKASNKALSIGLKYAMLQVFCIPTEDDKDPDAETPQPAAGSINNRRKTAEKEAPETAPTVKGSTSNSLSDKTPQNNTTKNKKYTPEEAAALGEILKKKDANGADYFTAEELEYYRAQLMNGNFSGAMSQAKAVLASRSSRKAAENLAAAVDGEIISDGNASPAFDLF